MISRAQRGRPVSRRGSVVDCYAWLLFVQALCVAASSALSMSTLQGRRGPTTTAEDLRKSSFLLVSRRAALDSCCAFLTAQLLTISSLPAAAEDEAEAEGLSARDRVARLLHAVPTFCIVDPKGVPYVVVGEDAKVTGYFFTEYEEADRILRLARVSADTAIRNSNERMANPWKNARISTVPMDVAATLVTKSLSSRTHFQIAPSEVDIEDALEVTGKASLAEGKVPLFYYENFTLEGNMTPLYFAKAQLEHAWQDSGGDAIVQPNVTELFSVLSQIVQKPKDVELTNLLIVPPENSAARAKDCTSKGGKESPFLLGQQILVL